MGHTAQSVGGPAPKGQLWGAELPREASVWTRADLSCVSGRRAELTDGDEQGGESPGRVTPLGQSVEAPPHPGWASSGAGPMLIPAVPPCLKRPLHGPGCCLSPHFPSGTAGLMLCFSCLLCRRDARVLPACVGAARTHMLDGSLGFAVSTSGLKATEPLREGPAACLDAEPGDWGVDAPAVERPG